MNKRISISLLLSAASFLLASCGGGSGGGTPTPTPMGTVTLSGRISFDRVPFKLTLGTGLDFSRVIDAPARGVVVEAIDSATSAILATANTDASGNYSMTVTGNTNLFVRAKTQMLMTGLGASWNFRVLNNTGGNALYALDGQSFNSGTVAVTRNLRAVSGWNGTTYTGTRAAAPFAILDTLYQAKELLLSVQSNLAMPALDVFWSALNRPSSQFCPSNGDIVSTAYERSTNDNCPTSNVAPSGIYVQGDFANGAGDTDEFDQPVIAHEFGHYVEDMLARSDSIGGSHSPGDRLDMRVALSEGWGNAFSAMVLNDPIYRDSMGVNFDNHDDIEAGPDPNSGWFSEATVGQVLWDVFDSANESGDGVTLPFASIYQTLIGPQRTTFALTDLHTLATGLKSISPSNASAIDLLLTAPPRSITGTGDFAAGETNGGGLSQPNIILPLYKSLSLNLTTAPICTSAQFGSFNKLGNRQFLRFDLAAPATVTFTVTASAGPVGSQPATDPDAVLWRQGTRVWIGSSDPTTTPAVEQSTPLQLQSGTYVLEIYDYLYANPGASLNASTLRCMTVLATG